VRFGEHFCAANIRYGLFRTLAHVGVVSAFRMRTSDLPRSTKQSSNSSTDMAAGNGGQSFLALPTFEDPSHDQQQEYQGKEKL
jgi:hypothetical protein